MKSVRFRYTSTSGAFSVTVTAHTAFSSPQATVMVAVPAALAVTTPSVTPATASLEEVHIGSPVPPEDVSVSYSPTNRDMADLDRETGSGGGSGSWMLSCCSGGSGVSAGLGSGSERRVRSMPRTAMIRNTVVQIRKIRSPCSRRNSTALSMGLSGGRLPPLRSEQ